MMISRRRIRLMLINFDLNSANTHTQAHTHVPPHVSSFLPALLISQNQSAALRQYQSTCIHTLLIRALGTDTQTYTHMYVHEHFCYTSLWGGGGWLSCCTLAVIRERRRNIVRERMCTTVLSTFLCPYMVVNHAGEGGVFASLSWHVTWKQEVLWCRREGRKGKDDCWDAL